MTERQAAVKVKDYLNYDQAGTHGRQINAFLQFFKVGMTGADAMRRSFMLPNGKFDIKKFGAYAVFFALIGAAKYKLDDELLGEDEDGKRRLHKIRLDTLTQKALIPTGDKIWGFNIGLGLPQMLLAPGMIFAAVNSGHATATEGERAMYELIARNAPVRPSGLPADWGWQDMAVAWSTGSLVPAPVAGIVATAANKDAFGRPVHTQYVDTNKFKSEQGRIGTPDIWSNMARELNDMGIADMYPEDIRYLVRTYGGSPVAMLMKATVDADAETNMGGGEVEVIGRVTGAEVIDEKFYLRNETYDTLGKLSVAKRRLDAVKKKADRQGTDPATAERQFLAATPAVGAQLNAHKSLDKAITDYNTRIREIKKNKLSGAAWQEAERKKADSKLREAYLKADATLQE
jgi:hypothetical protein